MINLINIKILITADKSTIIIENSNQFLAITSISKSSGVSL